MSKLNEAFKEMLVRAGNEDVRIKEEREAEAKRKAVVNSFLGNLQGAVESEIKELQKTFSQKDIAHSVIAIALPSTYRTQGGMTYELKLTKVSDVITLWLCYKDGNIDCLDILKRIRKKAGFTEVSHFSLVDGHGFRFGFSGEPPRREKDDELEWGDNLFARRLRQIMRSRRWQLEKYVKIEGEIAKALSEWSDFESVDESRVLIPNEEWDMKDLSLNDLTKYIKQQLKTDGYEFNIHFLVQANEKRHCSISWRPKK